MSQELSETSQAINSKSRSSNTNLTSSEGPTSSFSSRSTSTLSNILSSSGNELSDNDTVILSDMDSDESSPITDKPIARRRITKVASDSESEAQHFQ